MYSKICFIILHYRSIDDTSLCIDSIVDMQSDIIIDILVVDNASNDGSGEVLTEKYKRNEKIKVYILHESEGFSYGNNFGYKLVKNQSYDFIVVCNNDVIFEQKNFVSQVYDIYKKEHFYVLGPDVYVPYKNYHDSPHHTDCWSKEYVVDMINKLQRSLKYPIGRSTVNMLWETTCMFRLYRRMVYPCTPRGRANIDNSQKTSYYSCLSGCCLIFSKDYCDKNDSIFFPETNFYFEEELLQFRCINNNWKMVYSPDICVIHNEGTATQKKVKNCITKRKHKWKNMINSGRIYVQFLEENQQKEKMEVVEEI